MIFSDWQEQHQRMRRSHDRLRQVSGGRQRASSDEARDALLHFYQDAYHLKDWLINSAAVTKADVEAFVSGSPELSLCADLCNGSKHFQLRRARTGDAATGFSRQHVTVLPAPAGSGEPPSPSLHAWTVTSQGRDHSAVWLAGEVVKAWDEWLTARGLLS